MKSHKYWSIGHWFPWSELATLATRIWNQLINILHSVHWFVWLWPFTQVIKWFLANPEKRKRLQLKKLRNNKGNRGVFHYIWAWWKGEIPSGSFRSTLPFLEKMAYIVYLQIVALRFQKIISQIPERCFFLPVKICPAHPQFKHNFHVRHFSVPAEAAIKHIIIFGSKIRCKIFYQCHCPVDHITKSID